MDNIANMLFPFINVSLILVAKYIKPGEINN